MIKIISFIFTIRAVYLTGTKTEDLS